MSRKALKRQFEVEGIKVQVYADREALGLAAAKFVAGRLRQALAKRGDANIVLATGASQHEFIAAFRQEQGIDWSSVTAFHLDEYLGISENHPASFRRYLHERLFDRLTFDAVYLLKGDAADPVRECRRYASLLDAKTIDIACIGIGQNAHLAFNDPPADFNSLELVHVVTLDEACRDQQVREGHFAEIGDVPPKALSLSVPAILSANTISCVVPDRRKAEAIRCALEGPISPDCPASALRKHRDCHLYLDVDSASLLSGVLFPENGNPESA